MKVACFCPEHGVKRLNHRKEIKVSEKRFENLTSIQLAAELKKGPVAYFPIGSLEHHGLHLPVGFDSMSIILISNRKNAENDSANSLR